MAELFRKPILPRLSIVFPEKLGDLHFCGVADHRKPGDDSSGQSLKFEDHEGSWCDIYEYHGGFGGQVPDGVVSHHVIAEFFQAHNDLMGLPEKEEGNVEDVHCNSMQIFKMDQVDDSLEFLHGVYWIAEKAETATGREAHTTENDEEMRHWENELGSGDSERDVEVADNIFITALGGVFIKIHYSYPHMGFETPDEDWLYQRYVKFMQEVVTILSSRYDPKNP